MTHGNTDKRKGKNSEETPSENPALQVPIDEVVDYMNRIHADAKCSFCNTGDYGVIPSPSGATAAVVAAPVPNVQHLGVWFFLATCLNCGHTIFMSTRHVLAKIKSEQ